MNTLHELTRRSERRSTTKAFSRFNLTLTICLAAALGFVAPVKAENERRGPPIVTHLVSGLGPLFGTTVGPDGMLYVCELTTGSILEVDPETGDVSTFATGLPTNTGIGGPYDVTFVGNTAYVLETLVDPFVGGNSIDGIYRIDGPNSFTVIADIGQFALEHPPIPPYFVPTGVQFAMQVVPSGFLVTDGHHNRVYHVTFDGEVSELIAFDNIVPTGLDILDNTIYMAEAGPVPHLRRDGKIIAFEENSPEPTEVASGGPLLVDVEFAPGLRHPLYALAQGRFPRGGAPGDPALPNTGELMMANANGNQLTPVVLHLDRPTSLDFIGHAAYVVGLGGDIWKVENGF